MDTSRNQGGLQLLLSAEQEAKEIVNAAKSAKMARLKQAKKEAEAEVAEYRAQLEREFQRKVAEGTEDSGANVKRLEVETDSKIHHLKNDAGIISQDVSGMLLKLVTTVIGKTWKIYMSNLSSIYISACGMILLRKVGIVGALSWQ